MGCAIYVLGGETWLDFQITAILSDAKAVFNAGTRNAMRTFPNESN